MNMFNSTNFIKALKESYDAVPYIQGDQAAKVMVADAIKSHKFSPADVLFFICSELGNPSVKLGKDDWKDIIKKAIKRGGLVGKCLEACAGVLKGKDKVSNEDLFSAVVSACGENPELLMSELYLNKVGWMKVADTLVKTKSEETVETSVSKEAVETVKVETKATKKTAKKAKESIKVAKVDPRSKSIILVKDGVKKVWASYRECEKELGAGHGTVSQHLSGKLKSVKGWVLYKEEEVAPVESKKRSKSKGVVQMKKDKDGRLVVVSTYGSLTEASKATGVSHSGISKTCSGTYQSAGGYVWKHAEAAA
ncbi:MAG: hypothetical protein II659_05750, partial [Bacteroidales bacterium]|nr:hypothetical protein [Bacteroidales bacterium]